MPQRTSRTPEPGWALTLNLSRKKRVVTPDPLPGDVPQVPGFGVRFRTSVPNIGMVYVYLCFQCPRALATFHEGEGRFTLSPVFQGVVLAERPFQVRWTTPEEAKAYVRDRVASGWLVSKVFGDPGPLPPQKPGGVGLTVACDDALFQMMGAWLQQMAPRRVS